MTGTRTRIFITLTKRIPNACPVTAYLLRIADITPRDQLDHVIAVDRARKVHIYSPCLAA